MSENAQSVDDQQPVPRARLWGYREILLLLACLAVSQLLTPLLAIAVAESAGFATPDAFVSLLRTEPRVAVPVQIVGWLPPLAYIGLVVRRGYGMSLRSGLAWTALPRPLLSYLRTGVLLALGSLLAGLVLGAPDQRNPMQELLENRAGLWALVLFGVVFAPVIEEVVFRGFLFGALERAHGDWPALVATSLLFATLHGTQYAWQWQLLVILTGAGLALGAIRITSGSTKASFVVHASYNALLFLVGNS